MQRVVPEVLTPMGGSRGLGPPTGHQHFRDHLSLEPPVGINTSSEKTLDPPPGCQHSQELINVSLTSEAKSESSFSSQK